MTTTRDGLPLKPTTNRVFVTVALLLSVGHLGLLSRLYRCWSERTIGLSTGFIIDCSGKEE